jgi:hypothetical protein
MTTFRIATFVDDDEQYGEMRTSFEAAGFVSPLARFTIEQGEPYRGITRLGKAQEPYVMLVHQDVRCEWGDTADSLQARLAELTRVDPDWAVAGNAGRNPDVLKARLAELVDADRDQAVKAKAKPGLNPIRHISDPHGTTWSTGLPKRVLSLDENLLILRTARRPACSAELSGWHLYGTDVVLNAALVGGSAYVIDFRLTHLSPGNPDGYERSRRQFVEHWQIPVT